MAASTNPRWHRDGRFLIPTIISLIALALPIIREDIINRPTSREAQLLITPAAVGPGHGLSELTIEGRGFHGDVDKRVRLVIQYMPGADRRAGTTVLLYDRDILVNGDGAFTETVALREISLEPGIGEVTAYRITDRNGHPSDTARRTSSKFTVLEGG